MLSNFGRFVTGERIMEAVKWGWVNMLAIEKHDVGPPASVSKNQKAEQDKVVFSRIN